MLADPFALLSLASAAPLATASGVLAVGSPAEPTAVMVTLRLTAAAWGLALLLAGHRHPRATVATFVVVVGIALGAPLAGHAYTLTLAVAVLTLAAGVALYLVLPRLVLGVACLWPLPALYAAHLVHTGSFEGSAAVALALAALGAVAAVIRPETGTLLLAAATGSVLLRLASPWPWPFWLLPGVALVAAGWQAAQLRRFAGHVDWMAVAGASPRLRRWRQTVAAGAGALVAAALVVCLLAPQYGPGVGPNPHRLDRLLADGHMQRPTLVFTTQDNLYLAGRAFPVALVSARPGLLSRLVAPVMGHSRMSVIHDARAVKEQTELGAMRRAAAITSRAFADLRPLIAPGSSEAAVAQRVLESFQAHGATGVAFASVVASGANAVLPHYQRNDSTMTEGLVVIDIGCSVDGYASDMTRTFPVSGQLRDAERRLFQVVLAAGDAARAMLRAGVTMRELDDAARAVIDEAGFAPFFLHSLGHHVGLHVHDPHRDRLEAAMVVTIEPGLYIPRGADIDPAYWNLGIRVEDTYIVTEHGCEQITDYPRMP